MVQFERFTCFLIDLLVSLIFETLELEIQSGFFLGTVGHHDLSVERLDVSYDGELIASSSHDNCVKFWNIKYFEEMDYDKTKKPFLDQKGVKMRRKDNKMQRAKESEHQLPSSNRGNRKDFFKELE